jgi:hypothetical protein
VPGATEGDIQKATGIEAVGIVVPTVDTVEEAEAGVRWAKYPPLGRRSLFTGQSHALGRFLRAERVSLLLEEGLGDLHGFQRSDGFASVRVQLDHDDLHLRNRLEHVQHRR